MTLHVQIFLGISSSFWGGQPSVFVKFFCFQTSFLPIYSTALSSHLNIHKFMLMPLSYSITQHGFCQLVSVQEAPLDTHLACRCIGLVLCWGFFVWSVLVFSVYLEHFMALFLSCTYLDQKNIC